MKYLKLINPENVSKDEVETFRVRKAARAIVINEYKQVALLRVKNENYFKLPGGGVEDGESIEVALSRECLEELGYDIKILNEVGIIEEYIKTLKIKQISYCYIARIKGAKLELNYTEEEIAHGLEVAWMSYEESLKNMKESNTLFEQGMLYMIPRDTAFLEESGVYFN